MTSPRAGKWFLVCGLLMGGLPVGGCSEPPPPVETHAVVGRVLYKNGEPMANGMIEFSSKEDPALNMSAFTEADGTFELVTLYDQQNLPGAVEGPCQVAITLPIVSPIPKTILLREPYVVRPQDNNFEIQLNVNPQQ